MRFVGDCYRAHDPKWAFAALSGDGAALFGGRFNPPGIPALYLSVTLDGALAEASQSFAPKIEPLTICLYDVDCDDVVDPRATSAIQTQGFDPKQLECAWRTDEARGRKPYTWHLAETLIDRGASGVFVRSFAKAAKPMRTTWCFGDGATICHIVFRSMIRAGDCLGTNCRGLR